MPENRTKTFLAINLLQIAGFLVMAGFGFLGLSHFILGASLYLLGALLAVRFSEKQDLQNLGFYNLLLFVINLVFYSSAKIASFGDVSFYIYLLVAADLAWLAWLFAFRFQKQVLDFPYLKQVAFFLAAVALSAAGVSHLKDVLYFFILNAGAFAVFYSVINLGFARVEKVIAFAKALVSLGAVSAGVAIWQLYSDSFKFFYYPFINERDQLILEKWEMVSRVVGTWQHPSYLGIFLVFLIPLSAYLLFYASSNWFARGFWAASLVLMSSVLLLTNTRSSVLAGALSVGVMFLLVNIHSARRAFSVKKMAVLGLLAAASLLFYQFVLVTEIYTKPQAWRVDASATIWGRFLRADTMSTESLVQRSQLYALAKQTYFAHPVSGIGAKNFQYEVEKVFGTGTDGHNLIFQTAAEMGTVGVIAILWLYGALIVNLYRRLNVLTDLKIKYLYAAFFGTVLLILFDSMFNNPLYSLRLVAIFWIIVSFQHLIYEKFKNSGETLD